MADSEDEKTLPVVNESAEQIEELLKRAEAPPQVREKIKEVFLGIASNSRVESVSPQLPPPESLRIMNEFLVRDSDNSKEIALRELDAREKLETLEAEREAASQKHSIR